MWIPLRASASLAMTAPVISGYCAVQLIILWVAAQGVGLADMAWSAAASKLESNGGFVVSPSAGKDAYALNKQLYLSLVCMVSKNIEIEKNKLTPGMVNPASKVEPIIVGNLNQNGGVASSLATKFAIYFGDKTSDNSTQVCGGFEWNSFDKLGADLEAATANGTNLSSLMTTTAHVSTMGNDVINAQRNAIINSMNMMLPFVVASVNSNKPPDFQMLDDASQNYMNVMANSVQGMKTFLSNENMNGFSADLSKDGWAAAGSYYIKINHLNAAANNIINSAPDGITVSIDNLVDANTAMQLKQANAYLTQFDANQRTGADHQVAIMNNGVFSHVTNAIGFGKADEGSSFQAWVIEQMAGNGDPMTRMQNIGHGLIDSGEMLLAAYVAVDVVTNVATDGMVSKLKTVKNNVSSEKSGALGGFFSSLFWLLMAIGVLLAFVVPMIPYILMLFSVMSWFTSIFIAMIAAPLWAVSHATPDGHEAFGAGERGYILLMSVTLRPVLTVIAMFGSMAILYAIDMIFNIGYSAAMDGAQANSTTGVVGFVVALIMYCVISLSIVYASYRLVQSTPDAILKWIGGSDDDSIGVEQHGERTTGMLIAARGHGGNLGRAIQSGAAAGKETGANAGKQHNTNRLAAGGTDSGSEKA